MIWSFHVPQILIELSTNCIILFPCLPTYSWIYPTGDYPRQLTKSAKSELWKYALYFKLIGSVLWYIGNPKKKAHPRRCIFTEEEKEQVFWPSS
ncbi:PREDICTED: uncharacterized protein LOC106816380 isoform X2 [Priapulus caudatus]|uniref:Uncharacterized protein LOC106816380 isoform X2 n=1 Tax=Priapulus caudatus TaxID=37621 RepID=A0ABM1EW96_PRICU|nr:PREDICTED: uncharacterized protein LOC106816380 isoform X2 [Priapulus caudatus]